MGVNAGGREGGEEGKGGKGKGMGERPKREVFFG